MPRKSAIKCYFGCATEGPFHQFPKPEYPTLEKFEQWKLVLNEDIKRKGDSFIYNNIRICDGHFEEFYRSASKRLTRNAVPTLNLDHNILTKECLATADLLLLVDKLFDSFNDHGYQDSAKIYKSALRKNSLYFRLLDEALPILNSMGYEVNKELVNL